MTLSSDFDQRNCATVGSRCMDGWSAMFFVRVKFCAFHWPYKKGPINSWRFKRSLIIDTPLNPYHLFPSRWRTILTSEKSRHSKYTDRRICKYARQWLWRCKEKRCSVSIFVSLPSKNIATQCSIFSVICLLFFRWLQFRSKHQLGAWSLEGSVLQIRCGHR